MTLTEIAALLAAAISILCIVMFMAQLFMARRSFGPRPAGVMPVSQAEPLELRSWIWVMAPLGAILLGIGGHSAWKQVQTWRWPGVQGNILEARVEAVTENRFALSRRQVPVRRYAAKVRYAYAWNGKDREGDRLYRATGTWAYEWSARLSVRDLEPGKLVTIYVNPENPDEAVLRRTVRTSTAFGLILGLILCGTAIWLA